MEMVFDAYQRANEVAPNILERQFPLPASLVTPLPSLNPESKESSDKGDLF